MGVLAKDWKRAPSRKMVGTSLQGEVHISYATLVRIFGKPLKGDGYKTQAEWVLQFKDGTVATIYDYKEGKSYLGRHGKPANKVTSWHIGGKNKKAVAHVKHALGR